MPDEPSELKEMAYMAVFGVVVIVLAAIVVGIIFGWLPVWPVPRAR